MEAMLAILFVMAMAAIVVVGSLAIEAAWQARMHNHDKEARHHGSL